MIEVRSLQKTYRSHGAAVGLLGADFIVPDGQIVGILGENGAGKTTMLRCIAGLLPHKGTALLDGRPAGVQYASKLPALSWLDHDCSYASNEVAINWNAPLVYVAAGIEALTPEE